MATDSKGCNLPEQSCSNLSRSCSTVCACNVQYNDYSHCSTYVEQNTFSGNINAHFRSGNIVYANDINTLYGDVSEIATHFKTSLGISSSINSRELIKKTHPDLARDRTALVGSYTADPNLSAESDYVSKLNGVEFSVGGIVDANNLANLVDVIKAISNNCRCICDNITICSSVCVCRCHY
jgi:hypothetical protein